MEIFLIIHQSTRFNSNDFTVSTSTQHKHYHRLLNYLPLAIKMQFSLAAISLFLLNACVVIAAPVAAPEAGTSLAEHQLPFTAMK
jgi:uncharacterized membrane protein YkvI